MKLEARRQEFTNNCIWKPIYNVMGKLEDPEKIQRISMYRVDSKKIAMFVSVEGFKELPTKGKQSILTGITEELEKHSKAKFTICLRDNTYLQKELEPIKILFQEIPW